MYSLSICSRKTCNSIQTSDWWRSITTRTNVPCAFSHSPHSAPTRRGGEHAIQTKARESNPERLNNSGPTRRGVFTRTRVVQPQVWKQCHDVTKTESGRESCRVGGTHSSVAELDCPPGIIPCHSWKETHGYTMLRVCVCVSERDCHDSKLSVSLHCMICRDAQCLVPPSAILFDNVSKCHNWPQTTHSPTYTWHVLCHTIC